MPITVIEKLTAMSRAPQPAPWTNALTPLAHRAEAAELKLLAQRAENSALADQLALFDIVKLATRVTEDALPLVGKLVGRRPRAALRPR